MARLFVLESEDLSVGLTDLGCTLVFVRVKAAGVNAVLGYPDAGGYARGTSCVGASVGRYAGRIGNARFTLNGRDYALVEKLSNMPCNISNRFGQCIYFYICT